MSVVLPSTVEEINCLRNPFFYSQLIQVKDSREDFPNIEAGKFKRLLSIPCPEGNQWSDMPDFDTYLTFNEDLGSVEVIHSHEDRLVPGGEQRPRSESISSVTSSMDDKTCVYNNLGVKTFSTLCVDSGSTCISSDHSYVNVTPLFKDLDAEETFQNLHPLLSQGPELHNTDTTSSISSAHSPLSDNLDYSALSNISMISNNSQDSSFSDGSAAGFKRSAATLDDDYKFIGVNSPKRSCGSPDGRFVEMRRKNNAASKNCRKTRKEKQKEMESRVTELEREREDLQKQIKYLEIMTEEFRRHISSIMRPVV